ncbi:MAG: hypothetical protein ACXVEC_10775 [Nocardioides sp.]
MQQWIVPAVTGVLALLALVLAVAWWRSRAGTVRELASARAEAAALRAQVEEIERRLAATERPRPVLEQGYVITRLGENDPEPAVPVERVDGALFADLVLRETVVKAASLAHGVRRALAPETRHRIRFEVRREVKRARKQRRSDLRDARRDRDARRRLGEDGATA